MKPREERTSTRLGGVEDVVAEVGDCATGVVCAARDEWMWLQRRRRAAGQIMLAARWQPNASAVSQRRLQTACRNVLLMAMCGAVKSVRPRQL